MLDQILAGSHRDPKNSARDQYRHPKETLLFFDEVLKDEALIARLQAATTQDDAKAAVRAAAGVKINLDREITVEFTPAK